MELNQFNHVYGIDISKEWFDIALENKVIRVKQDKKHIIKFIRKYLSKKQKVLCVLESTGGYERLVAQCLMEAGFEVHVAHPNKVVAFAKAKGRLAKTDKIDARILSEYGRFIDSSEIRNPITPAQDELRELGARLVQLKAMHHQEKCRLGMIESKIVKKSIEKTLKLIEAELEGLEEKLLTLIHTDPRLKALYVNLQSMKGVGKSLALMLIIDLPELGQLNGKQVAALVGVAPITRESGKKTGYSATGHGRSAVRKVLYMAALVACRHNSKMKPFYERLVEAGKAKKVAIVAVMRKMLVILNAMAKTGEPFNA